MKYVLLALLCILPLASCKRSSSTFSKPDITAIGSNQAAKDNIVIGSADSIDKKAEAGAPPKVAADIKTDTDNIRAAVAAAPAAEVSAAFKQLENIIAILEKQLDDVKKEAEAARNAELNKQQSFFRWLGFILVGLGIAGAILSKGSLLIESSSLGGAGMLSLGAAQIIGKAWFLPSVGILGLVIAGLCGWWLWSKHAESKKRQEADFMARQLQEKTAEIKKTVLPVIKTLDAAYEDASDSVRKVLDEKVFGKLSQIMSDRQKAVVHELRAEDKTQS